MDTTDHDEHQGFPDDSAEDRRRDHFGAAERRSHLPARSVDPHLDVLRRRRPAPTRTRPCRTRPSGAVQVAVIVAVSPPADSEPGGAGMSGRRVATTRVRDRAFAAASAVSRS